MYDSKTKRQLGKSLLLCVVVVFAMVAITIGGSQSAADPNSAEPVKANPVKAEPAAPAADANNVVVVEVPPADACSVDAKAPAESEGPAAEVTSDTGDTKSFKFAKDCTVRKAIDLIASIYQKNVKCTPNVDGPLGIRELKDVTFEQALSAILDESFRYEIDDNLVRIYTKAEYVAKMTDESRMTHGVFTLYYISATEAQALIMPVLSKNAKVTATAAASRTLPTGESISSVAGAGDSAAMNDMLLIYDFPENIERAGEVLDAVDTRPLQVLVEATIMAVTLNEDSEFGIDWSTLGTVVTQVPAAKLASAADAAGDLIKGTNDYVRSVGTNQVTKTGGFTFGVAHDNVGVLIRAVEQTTDVTILANPKILAVNKQLGQVYIGTKLGYTSQTTMNDNTSTEKVDFLDTGTKLSFRPFIANDGYIRMDIHPKDSSGELNAEGVPDETSAELVTNIIVKDGETVIIGGMFRDKTSSKRTQIPLLGDLPVVGGAFRGTADSTTRQEVIVMLTPHIIKEPSETKAHLREADVSRKHWAAMDEYQDFGRAKIAEEDYVKATRAYVEGDYTTAMKYVKKALHVRPGYLEVLRLRDRILAESNPEELSQLKRILLDKQDEEEADNFRRR